MHNKIENLLKGIHNWSTNNFANKTHTHTFADITSTSESITLNDVNGPTVLTAQNIRDLLKILNTTPETDTKVLAKYYYYSSDMGKTENTIDGTTIFAPSKQPGTNTITISEKNKLDIEVDNVKEMTLSGYTSMSTTNTITVTTPEGYTTYDLYVCCDGTGTSAAINIKIGSNTLDTISIGKNNYFDVYKPTKIQLEGNTTYTLQPSGSGIDMAGLLLVCKK